MVSASFTETAVELEGDNIPEPGSSGISPISANLYWKVKPIDKNKSFHVSLTAPMILISSGNTYFNLSGGFEYYFSEYGHKVSYNKDGMGIGGTPKLRYFALAEIGVGFASYTTEIAKSNDTFFEGGGGGGLSYAFSDKWGLRGFATVGMGSGSLTSSMIIKFFVGGNFFLGD